MVAGLQARGIADQTLIIVSAKHGQSPIDVTKRQAVSDTPYTKTPGYGFHVADDVGLVWLAPQTAAAARASASDYLVSQADALRIASLAGREILQFFYQDPATDSSTPGAGRRPMVPRPALLPNRATGSYRPPFGLTGMRTELVGRPCAETTLIPVAPKSGHYQSLAMLPSTSRDISSVNLRL